MSALKYQYLALKYLEGYRKREVELLLLELARVRAHAAGVSPSHDAQAAQSEYVPFTSLHVVDFPGDFSPLSLTP